MENIHIGICMLLETPFSWVHKAIKNLKAQLYTFKSQRKVKY